ncbi:MAG: mechanosensitive ion channel [Alphaproteobacteria bacterium]|nr:mechanosensitive ion channel [Alphaproteobacteria bacterium]
MDSNQLISDLRTQLAWAPPWAASVAVAVLALLIAQLFYGLVVRMVRRGLHRRKDTFWRSLLMRSRGPGRLALILATLSWSVHAAPFPPREASLMQHGLGILFIVLVGWVLMTAVDIASALYLRRYRTDMVDNLLARKHLTQIRILKRAITTLIGLLTAAAALMTIPSVRQLGVSLLAAGGAAGIIVGLALQPVLSNLMAGVQIALTQPIRIDDAVIVNGEFGRVEEINSTYVVVRLWDLRSMVVPLKFFLEQPFQNWTRETANLLGTVMLYLDYTAPVDRIRGKFEELVRASKLWDGKVCGMQVTDAKDRVIEVRGLLSAADSGKTFDLRCEVREKLIAWLQAEMPAALPRDRQENLVAAPAAAPSASGAGPGEKRVQ